MRNNYYRQPASTDNRRDKQKARDIEAYAFFRDEIKREDEIIDKRLTSSLTLQGFLIASVGVIISNGIGSDVPTRLTLVATRQAILFVIICIGFLSSLSSLAGVVASRLSISAAIKERYDNVNISKIIRDVPGFPQAHGIGLSFDLGKWFPIMTVTFFAAFWLAVGAIYIKIIDPNPLSLLQGGAERRKADEERIGTVKAGNMAAPTWSACIDPHLTPSKAASTTTVERDPAAALMHEREKSRSDMGRPFPSADPRKRPCTR